MQNQEFSIQKGAYSHQDLLAASKKYRLGDVLVLWMEHNRIHQKGGTMAKYQFMIERHLIPDIGSVQMSDLTSTMINKYLSDKLDHGRLDHSGGLSASYVRTMRAVLHSAVRFAVSEGICSELNSPIYMPPKAQKELSLLDYDDQRKLERYAAQHIDPTTTGVMLSLHAGMRIGEVCALSWNDVDMRSKVIHIRHTIARVNYGEGKGNKTHLIIDTPKTRSSVRDIPISSVLWPILKTAKETFHSPYVASEQRSFLSPRTFEYRYHGLLRKCDISNVNYHALRHTFATRCIEAGVDVKSLSEMLGHSNVSTTLKTYVHSSMQLKRSQLEKFVSFFT